MKKSMLCLAVILLASCVCSARRVSILGDSYSTFQGAITPETNEPWYFSPRNPQLTDVDSVSQTWWGILLNSGDWQLERNNSYSGSTICNRGYNGDDYSHRSFTNRMSDLGHPELILVFGATNDYWAHVALTPDSPEGAGEPHPFYTFRPALQYMLQQLPAIYPGVQVVFMLNDEIQGPVRDIIVAECQASGTPLLKLHDIAKQAGHPNRAGMQAIADQLSEFLQALNPGR